MVDKVMTMNEGTRLHLLAPIVRGRKGEYKREMHPLAIATWFFKRRMLASSRNMRRTNSAITASFSESIAGARTTKSLNRERRNLGEFGVMTGSMHGHSMRNALQAAVFLPMAISVYNSFVVPMVEFYWKVEGMDHRAIASQALMTMVLLPLSFVLAEQLGAAHGGAQGPDHHGPASGRQRAGTRAAR
mgnify:CR=1 FL=1